VLPKKKKKRGKKEKRGGKKEKQEKKLCCDVRSDRALSGILVGTPSPTK